jgi:hypothetical protein
VADLLPLLDDEEARSGAARTLAAIGPAAAMAVPALERYIEDPRREHAVLDALWKITRDERYAKLAVPYLLTELAREEVWRRLRSAEALGRLGGAARHAAPDLARLAADENEDEYVRDAAREALAAIG